MSASAGSSVRPLDGSDTTVVVGVADRQAGAVLLVAAAIATQFEARLICAVADPDRYATTDRTGRRGEWPIDPDAADDEDPAARVAALEQHVRDVLGDGPPRWSVRSVAGEPSRALADLAADEHAMMIVIGTSRRSLGRSMREFFAGSIAAHLAHRQPRPVLVVPLDPVPDAHALPWSGAAEDRA